MTDDLTPMTNGAEGWGWPAKARTQHYFRAERSLCGRWRRDGIALAGNLEEHEPEDCATCLRMGNREVREWYETHSRDVCSGASDHDDGCCSYAFAHDDGQVRR